MKSQDQKIAQMTFAAIYPLHLKKIKRKGRNETGLQQIIEWFTGHNIEKQQKMIRDNVNFEEFFFLKQI